MEHERWPRLRFIYLNGMDRAASARVQRHGCNLATMIGK